VSYVDSTVVERAGGSKVSARRIVGFLAVSGKLSIMRCHIATDRHRTGLSRRGPAYSRFPINATRIAPRIPSESTLLVQPSTTSHCRRSARLLTCLRTVAFLHPTLVCTMASHGTMRGTPTRSQGRGQLPAFNNSPASSIPRPASEAHGPASASDAGASSTLTASRQKQSKRDEVR
jgi:hypothetical protein